MDSADPSRERVGHFQRHFNRNGIISRIVSPNGANQDSPGQRPGICHFDQSQSEREIRKFTRYPEVIFQQRVGASLFRPRRMLTPRTRYSIHFEKVFELTHRTLVPNLSHSTTRGCTPGYHRAPHWGSLLRPSPTQQNRQPQRGDTR
ncbi:hypothetical protein AAFN60_06535 [Roseibacillus persicicus]|uniref:hypothetical protein n=1 Tax=Roseibacillus persicicus TaxID=454148 RepID=UPI00398B7A53